MQRAESYAALAPLLSAQLRRGVVTNCFLSAEDYQRELPRGLYYEEREGCLLLLRQRPGHLILNFYLQPGGTFFLPDVKKPVVTELMEAFDVELGVDDLTPENFNSVEAIEELIESKQS